MTDEANRQIYTLNRLVTLVRNQTKICSEYTNIVNKHLDSTENLHNSTSDMLITMNSLISAKLTVLWDEVEKFQEELDKHSIMTAGLTVEELDDEYDEGLDG